MPSISQIYRMNVEHTLRQTQINVYNQTNKIFYRSGPLRLSSFLIQLCHVYIWYIIILVLPHKNSVVMSFMTIVRVCTKTLLSALPLNQNLQTSIDNINILLIIVRKKTKICICPRIRTLDLPIVSQQPRDLERHWRAYANITNKLGSITLIVDIKIIPYAT